MAAGNVEGEIARGPLTTREIALACVLLTENKQYPLPLGVQAKPRLPKVYPGVLILIPTLGYV